MLPNLDASRPIPHDIWETLAEYGATVNVSTLTTLLAFTDYGSVYSCLAVHLSNEDGTNTVNLIVEFSHGGTRPNDEYTYTKSAVALKEAMYYIDTPNPFTYIRLSSQTNSPFPTVAVKWALL